MRIFLAGGTGAVGRPLVSQLVAAGHDVTVFSRSGARVADLGVPGVTAAIGDALNLDDVMRSVQAARPDVVINQLTNLAQTANPIALKRGFTQTNREGGPMFDPEADAGFAAGVREALAQHPEAAITVTDYDRHINDPAFATEVAETMFRMLGKTDKDRP